MGTDGAHVPQNRALVTCLQRSRIFRDYERAFRETTGLPIALRPSEAFDLPHSRDPKENPFCALMATSNRSCAACLQLQQKLEQESQLAPGTLKCFAGLCDSAIPVRVGSDTVAFLRTGQIMVCKPSRVQFKRFTRKLLEWGSQIDVRRLEEAYFQTRVIAPAQYDSIVRMLTIFAQHLAELSNELIIKNAAAEEPHVARARAFIDEHHSEELTLAQVSQSVNLSAYYFCKTFKRATGITFTEYLARVRIERLKHLLLNPHTRISEAAYAVGFQSLSQFNRTFRRVIGESPTLYRRRMSD